MGSKSDWYGSRRHKIAHSPKSFLWIMIVDYMAQAQSLLRPQIGIKDVKDNYDKIFAWTG